MVGEGRSGVGAQIYVGVLGGVEKVEVVPAHEIPVTEAVKHEFATAAAADFPQQARYAHVVCGVVHGRERSDGLGGQSGTGIELVECLVHVGVVEFSEFGTGLGVVQRYF